MTSSPWNTQAIADAPIVAVPDGSGVRVLRASMQSGMITSTFRTGAVLKAIVHSTVEEIWYVGAAGGQLWRKDDATEDVVDLAPNVSMTVPAIARFQFRNHCNGMLQIIAVTVLPWLGECEAMAAGGQWPIKF